MCSNGAAVVHARSSGTATSSGRFCDGAPPAAATVLSMRGMRSLQRLPVVCSAIQEKERDEGKALEEGAGAEAPDAEAVTRKYGLEAGLWKIFTSKDDKDDKDDGGGENKDGKKKKKRKKQVEAKELLARYGGAYLATSISLSLVSFGLFYVLVDSGVDVPGLLARVGFQADATGEQVGTFALAYAAHKAASPIRFPPTVALTPIVAGWLGKRAESKDEQ